MNPIVEELERLIAAAHLIEIFLTIKLEAAYLDAHTHLSRTAWYEETVLNWLSIGRMN